MTRNLTPYDTGDRLEPQPWPLFHTEPGGSENDRDHYGYVDLDNDESATVFTIVGKRVNSNTADSAANASSYLLSVSRYDEDSTVEIDGNRTLVLNADTLAGLSALIDMARRGRDDFQYQAENTSDYSEEDVRVADEQWFLAEQAIREIQGVR